MSADAMDLLLFDYASGALAEGPALAVATLLALDPRARARYGAMEATGGALLDGLEPAPLSDGLLAATLERLGYLEQDSRPVPRPDAATRQLLPAPLWRYAERGFDGLPWKTWNRNVREAPLPLAERGHRASLLQVKGGHGVLGHTHHGDEYTVVLSGAFSDATGHYGPGALQVADGSMRHRPVADSGEDCLCLIVLSAPLRFTGPIGALANRLVKF